MGSVNKRPNGMWRARYRDPGGKQRARHFRRKADAERFLTSVEQSKLTGAYVDPSAGKVTFKTYAEGWRKVQVHRDGTATSVEQHLRLHIYPHLGDRPIGAIRQSEVQAMVQRISTTLAPSTVGVVYGRVAAIFRAAVRDRIIAATPCIDITLPKKPPAAMLEVLTTAQVNALVDAVPDRYRAAIITGAGLGLRPGELFGLTVDRVDFLRRTVRVDQQMVRVFKPADDGEAAQDDRSRERVRLAEVKTDASYRTLPLPQVVADALAAHLAARKEAEGREVEGLIFTNERGAPIQERPYGVMWASAAKRAGLPSWATPHDLRHYYASVLIRSGASVKVVQARLGHASAKVTLDIYGHLFPDEEDRTRGAIDDELGAGEDSLRTDDGAETERRRSEGL